MIVQSVNYFWNHYQLSERKKIRIRFDVRRKMKLFFNFILYFNQTKFISFVTIHSQQNTRAVQPSNVLILVRPETYLTSLTSYSCLAFRVSKGSGTRAVSAVWLRTTVRTWSQMERVSTSMAGWNGSAHRFQYVHSKYSILYSKRWTASASQWAPAIWTEV